MAQVVTTILLDDNPRGLRVIEIDEWQGKAFVVPRTKLGDLKTRKELYQPGIYVLFGEGLRGPKAYIGQSKSVIDRLLTHDAKRDDADWDFALMFVGGLEKTTIEYLESVAIARATAAARYEVTNSTAPDEGALSEAQKIRADKYFARVELIVEMLGFPLFQKVSESLVSTKLYTLKADGALATAQLLDDGSLNVRKGSKARIRETDAFFGWSKAARRQFVEDGTLAETSDGVSYEFSRDVVFSSPTAAAATVTGRPINGWTAWKDDEGNTLDENVRR